MGDVLSQSEIDNLLNALSSGELDVDEIKENSEQTVKDYDFARPSKFSKEHLRTLEIIFEHYGRLLTTNLPVYLRKSVQVEVMNSEAVTYSEFTNALSNPVLLGIVNFAPLHGNIIVVKSLDNLTEKERRVIELYYYEDLTLKEISNILEVSESRVSQLHTKGLIKMRKVMGPYMNILTNA